MLPNMHYFQILLSISMDFYYYFIRSFLEIWNCHAFLADMIIQAHFFSDRTLIIYVRRLLVSPRISIPPIFGADIYQIQKLESI